MKRHIKRFVTAECLKYLHKRFFLIFIQIAGQFIENNMVGHSPFATLIAGRKILIGNNIYYSRSHQIRTHIGKIGITTIIILQIVSCLFQRFGNRRQGLRLSGVFHDRSIGLSGISAKDRHQSPIGSETVGIKVRKQNALFREFIHPHSHIGQSTQGFHVFRHKTLQHHKNYIRMLYGKQLRNAIRRRLINHSGKNRFSFVGFHKTVLLVEPTFKT